MQRSILVFAPTELIFSVSLVEAEPAAAWVCLGCYSIPGTLSLGGYGFGGIIKECAAEPWLVFLLFVGEKSSKKHGDWGGTDGPSWEGLSVIFICSGSGKKYQLCQCLPFSPLSWEAVCYWPW